MRINRLALLTLSALNLSGAALADGRGFMKSADANHDGVVDQSEFQASRDKWFQELDADKDGFISADELKAAAAKMHAAWAQKHADAQATGTQATGTQATGTATTPPASDTSGDRFATRMLKRVDTDHDGKISQAEFTAAGTDSFKHRDRNGDGKLAGNELTPRRGGQFGPRFFARMDQDHDGNITKAEFTAAGDSMFQKLDKNSDGILSKDELPMGHAHDQGQAPAQAPAADQQPTP